MIFQYTSDSKKYLKNNTKLLLELRVCVCVYRHVYMYSILKFKNQEGVLIIFSVEIFLN